MRHITIISFIFLFIFLAACGGTEAPALPPTQAAAAVLPENDTVAETTAAESPTETAVLPTETPAEPLAAIVNGQSITLSEYERELARYEQAQAQLGQSTANNDYQSIVLEALIEKLLITQAAEAAGLIVTEDMVNTKMAELESAAGSTEQFSQWLALNQWTEADFRKALATEMITGQMRDRVTADVPTTSEQVNARYIQVDDGELAATLHQRILAGDDFALLAQQNSLDQITSQNGGELGFFTRGSLLVPEVEAAAFALSEPGAVSDLISVVDSETGQTTFYLVQLIERDRERPLTAELRYSLLQQAYQSWLSELWSQATIELLIQTN